MPSISKTATSSIYNTFSAVFLPTFLTLISMGFFLRMGWIVALAGPLKTVAIISLATLICLITALSISSTLSNIKMEGGGMYFLLSRTFGPEIGSAICLPLFLAQALSGAFFIMGFAEVLKLLFPIIPIKEVTLCLLVAIGALTLLSSKIILKTEVFIFGLLCFTILCFCFGPSLPLDTTPTPLPSIPFWALFATFFPIVTGIEGSLSFINKLKNPSKSIPIGLLSGIGCALCIYLGISYLLYKKAPNSLLIDPLVMKHLSITPIIVVIGILTSALSGALGSIISAANSLQAFAEDRIIPKILGKTHLSLLISLSVAFLGISFGSINAIAPILSTFFLISYGTFNAATAMESLIENPSWRPTLKLNWIFSLLGSILCFIVMLMVNPGVSLVSTLCIVFLYLLMKKRHLHSAWEDMRYSILLFLSRYAIYGLNSMKPSPKTWRPNLLVFLGDPLINAHLAQLTSSMTHKKGFLIISSIVSPEGTLNTENILDIEETKLSFFLEKIQVPALIKTKEDPDLLNGMKSLIEDIGLGDLSPNTIVLGASEQKEKIPFFAQIIQFAHKAKKNILIVRENGLTERLQMKEKNHQKKSIDVWWGGRSKSNSELMLILGYMLQTSQTWKGSILTLKTVVNIEQDTPIMQRNLNSFLINSRLQLNTDIAVHKEGDIFSNTMKTHSSASDLIFLGMKPPENSESLEDYSKYYENLLIKTQDYPSLIYTLAGESLDFNKILS